ncbi:MAG: YdcF family protein [Flavobacteriaceae bacterium]|nr:YdcF family protein [Flavobacteriaceae bacterium]
MKKGIRKILITLAVLPFLVLLLCNIIIERAVKDKTFHTIESVPKNKVGIILGTSRHLVEGGMNPFYTHRINATIALFEAGKIEYVLVSGDNGTVYYNEPDTMKKDLIKGGIPEDKIYMDFAGFRTLDSMVRAKEVFGLTNATVISQEFHNERAIYLAQRHGLHAVGYNAKDVQGNRGLKVHLREYFARVKVFVDILMKTQPKFLGKKVIIE